MQKQRRYDGVVMGPDGNPLTLDDLPPAGTTRWVIRRKAEVVAAVRGGLAAQRCISHASNPHHRAVVTAPHSQRPQSH